jgi:flagellar motor protein MotB
MMFKRPDDQNSRNGDDENPFLLSFSDLMASLLAIFILALVVMMIQLHLQKKKYEEDQVVLKEQYEKMLKEKDRLEKERKRIRDILEDLVKSLGEIQETQKAVATSLEGVGLREKTLGRMLRDIQSSLKDKGINVLVVENEKVLRIPEDELSFGIGQFTISDQYMRSADLIGRELIRHLRKSENRDILDTVFIEGHTDSLPNGQKMGNWGLSTYRAIALWLHWTDKPGNYASLKNFKSAVIENGLVRPLISTSGYADTRPSGSPMPLDFDNEGKGNSSNRRIDIRFTLASKEKEDLGGLKEKLEQISEMTDAVIRKAKEVE